MKKIYQQTSYDCLRACIASLFHKNLEEVPLFIDCKRYWFRSLKSWLKKEGCGARKFKNTVRHLDKRKYYILAVEGDDSGKAPHGVTAHAVISKGKVVVHDPDPNYKGRDTRCIQYEFYYGIEIYDLFID